ncbi:MAG: hypothetical protein ACW97Z_08625 [Candidatus Hodarchaeales archaeon]|jgi:hypothetical protein
MVKLNDDQKKVLDSLKKKSTFVSDVDNGFKGLPYKEIMKATDLTVEKTLLSLGALEAQQLIKHTCAIQRQIVDYLGHSAVEIAGQKVIRVFSLTSKGLKA